MYKRQVLDGLGNVFAGNVFRARQIGNRPRHFHDPVVSPRAEIQFRHRHLQQLLRRVVERAEFLQLLRPEARVAGDFRFVRETLLLPPARGHDASTDFCRSLAGFIAGNFPELYLRHFNVQDVYKRQILYWATITLGPLLLACALALAGSPHFQATKGFVSGTIIGGFIFQLLPLILLWLLFALTYQLVPNTKIHFGAALIGGMVGGTLWHLNNVFGFLYVSRVVSNSKIYGSLGLVPVFMAGLYFSWLILLFGAQVAYAFQNRKAYLQDKLVENVNQRGREFIALRLMACIGQRFQNSQPPVTLLKISTELDIPTRLALQVLQTLLTARLVIEVAGNESRYAPARPLDAITAHDVLSAMRAANGQEIATSDEPGRAEIFGEFARIQEAEKQAASSVTMLALVSRAAAQLEIAEPSKTGNQT